MNKNTDHKGNLLEAHQVTKWYGDKETKHVVLNRVSVAIKNGEFTALLGPSGAGKSTTLRILAGLISPSEGEVYNGGKPLKGPNPNAAIVFQNFALYPWLTVQKNVELGLVATNLSDRERKKRVTEAIQLIGLHGYENAYPKEISGGMKQRVGFARALVVQPDILMLDEPFSALDVLTAENLRHELLTLWLEHKIPTKAILMVTHNIEEAVSMADKLLILSSITGRVRVEVPGLPVEERMAKSAQHSKMVDAIYQIMTNPRKNPDKFLSAKVIEEVQTEESPFQILPTIHIGSMRGFLRLLKNKGGELELHSMQNKLSIDDMLSLTQLMDIMGFGGIVGNKIVISPLGKDFISSKVENAKKIFRQRLLDNVALIQFIVHGLQTNKMHVISKGDVSNHLKEYFSPGDAEAQIQSAIILGRYGDLFTYNDTHKEFSANRNILNL